LGSSRALLYFGSPAGLRVADPLFLDHGLQSGDEFGREIAALGDVNADGYSDFAVSARADGSAAAAGRVIVYLGGPRVVSFALLPIRHPNALFGAIVAGIGDRNGDGLDDMAVYDANERAVYVYRGSSSGIEGSPGETIVMPNARGLGVGSIAACGQF
jgi:hypothetical protein